MKKYTVSVSVNVEFDVEVEASSVAEAKEIAEERAYEEYLTAEPDELNAAAVYAREA